MSRARDLSKLVNPSVFSVDDSYNVGINSTIPDTKLDVVGVISATSFFGDGSNLTGAGSALEAASGTQRLVVTSSTSGIMTSASTDADLTWNSETNTLSATNVSIAGTLTYEDVTNIDSIGVITARSGIKVLSNGIDATGVITATSFSGDGSNLTGLSVSNFIASGTIPNGDTVVINTDGTVSSVSGVSTTNIGTPVVFESATISNTSATYDSTNNRVVIAYTDQGNSSYGTAIVGNVSGTSITFGTPVVFESASTSDISLTYDSTNNRVVIVYKDSGNFSYGTAVVGEVDSETNSISFGTPTVFENANINYSSPIHDPASNRIIIAYSDFGNSQLGTAVVGEVDSGTNTITFGTPTTFSTISTNTISAIYDSTNERVIIAFRGNSGFGSAIVVKITNLVTNTIEFSSHFQFNSSDTSQISAIYDSINQKVAIAYRDNGNSDYGTAVVGEVTSGISTSITFGTPVVFESATTNVIYSTFDSTNGKVVISYRDQGNSNYGTLVVGTVSGINTSISFDTPEVFESGDVLNISSTYDSTNEKVVIVYKDVGNSNYGTAVVFDESVVTNLTTENYIGIAAESISDGQTGKVNIVSGINTSQTGLTTGRTYYVQSDGTGISTVPSNPSVVAGTSISDTEILVQSNLSSFTNVIDDTTPQLGGNLDLNSNDITGTGNVNITGIVTGTLASFSDNVSVGGTLSIKGAVEKVNVGSYAGGILTLDASTGTVFTHDLQGGSVGLVSITNFPVETNSFHTVTVIYNQNSTGTANTSDATGVSTNITLNPSGASGFSTTGLCGTGTTVTLSTVAEDFDIVTYGIHYNGSGSGSVGNYKVFVIKSGDFRY